MDYPVKISVCNHRTDKKYKNQEKTWGYLKERNRTPVRTSETAEEYPKLPKAQRDAAKDHGGFVGGWLKGGIRKNGNVISRVIGMLDADKIPQGVDFPSEVEQALPGADYFIYSTHSHTLETPRYRVAIRLGREVSEDEYPALIRMVAKQIGIDYFDDTTYQSNRMMYWASCPSNGEFIFIENDGAPLDPDKYLSMYEDWRDITQWPTSSRESETRKREVTQQQDPLAKEGTVGAFCRTFPIEDAIDTFLSDTYAPSASHGRYDYIPADSSAGVVVYDGKWVYSHHASDPASGKLLNAFDLVRTHKFGDLDDKASFKAMCEFAVKDERVNALLLEERRQRAGLDFAEGEDWTKGLQRDKGGLLMNNLHNITLIVENDPELKAIVFNQLADGLEIKGEVPWKHPARFWRDADDAQLISYIDSHYGTFSARNYEIAVTKVADDRSYHPIREYLNSLPPWDGVPRVETLLPVYLGSDDNRYVRAVTRKTLCAAVARIFNPGVKFDNILVLNGAQGVGKSTLIAKLGGDWYSDSLSLTDMNDKTAAEKHQKGDPCVPPDSKDKFPPPTSEENIKSYLSWDDWKVLGLIASGEADEPGERIKNRDHFRCVHSTPQSPDFRDLGLFEEAANAIKDAGIPGFTDDASSSSYKVEEDIAILPEKEQNRKTVPLTSVSSIVRGLPPLKQQRIYVPNERRKDADAIISKIIGG